MEEERVRKLADTMVRGFLQNGAPKPNVDISLCQACNRMTDDWYSEWPKETKIIWICKKCRDEKAAKNRIELETILEKMCDEEN
jgi:hypothetical protein